MRNILKLDTNKRLVERLAGKGGSRQAEATTHSTIERHYEGKKVMQNTRLNSLVDRTTDRLGGWLQNPWRRISVLIISLLLGNYLGPTLSLVAGQRGQLDVVIAALLVALIELVSLVVYRRRTETRSLLLDCLNALKVGLTYSLFVDAFKLGS